MLKIAICEDEQTDLVMLRSMIEDLRTELPEEIHIDTFTKGEDLIDAVKKNRQYDGLLLDIYLDGLDGIETARAVRDILPDIPIAFLTFSREFALEAFELNAIHYLTKPFGADQLRELFQRLIRQANRPRQYLTIHSNTKTYSYPLSQIQKLQSCNKGVDIYLQDAQEPHRIPLSLIRVEEQLPPDLFLKISRGLIVKMSYILFMDNNVCRFRDGTSALISREEKKMVRKKYNDYLFSHSKKGEYI